MSYQLVKENNSSLIIITIIGSLFFFVFVLPRLEELFYKEKQNLKEKMETVTNDNKPLTKLDRNKCSRDCCAFTQWPSPHMPANDSDYVPTNINCNGGQGGGCLCVTKDDYNYLSRRAENNDYCNDPEPQPKFKCNLVKEDFTNDCTGLLNCDYTKCNNKNRYALIENFDTCPAASRFHDNLHSHGHDHDDDDHDDDDDDDKNDEEQE